ncbi:Polysaccharide lyase family 4 protein [Rhizoctonia solani]|uniref:Polysaccharide lyase family 4 protein n=1 Tax=Rhizoctonia solani TaxID=456999 RepID=A0A8H7M123_9AGAM|nr:Polysaccharide lyase family 4 protein [Rhizoctonia solani]
MFRRTLLSASLLLASFIAPAFAGFGVKESGNSFVVDTDGGLVFTVNKQSGDITSMLYNGIQAQDQTKFSHIGSGLGNAPCSWTKIGNYIKITCTTSTLTQYYVAQYKNPAIHMATYITAEPSVGELRFIARLNRASIPNGYGAANIAGSSGAIEGSDVFTVSGQTRSKWIGAYMIIPGTGYESSSGGPFFRDINNQGGSIQELYYYMNSGHTQTEAYRMGLHGPYLLQFTTGSTPSATSIWHSGRPRESKLRACIWSRICKGKASVVARADAGTGNYYSPAMKPGTYTMTKATPAVIWQLGEFDGTPRGFLNAELVYSDYMRIYQTSNMSISSMIETMHPSDKRMHEWPRTITIGQQGEGYFPMAIFKAIAPAVIRFSVDSSQTGARTLQIGITLAFAGGRPQVTINNWTGPTYSPPDQPNSRGVTRGTWRGNNIMYTINIPAGVLVSTGRNVLTITVISGSSGDAYLSPNIVVDAIRLY